MKYIRQTLAGMIVFFGLIGIFAQPVAAYDPLGDSDACKNNQSQICKEFNGTNAEDKVNNTVTNIINILLYAIGIISVIMIIIGGLKYTTSNGDSSSVASAKNTILYAVIGLVVALMAYAIVNFVVGRI